MMDMSFRVPSAILPHGADMRLLEETGVVEEGWVTFKVRRGANLVVYANDGTAPPELGLEIMAQACGMAAMVLGDGGNAARERRGVVGAIRRYEYDMNPLSNSDHLVARVRSDLIDDSVMVCDAELIPEGEVTPLQEARITLVFLEEDSK